jgi:hypothetical protein
MILSAFLDKKPGSSLATVLRTEIMEFLNQTSRSLGRTTGIPDTIATGTPLRRVWLELNARISDRLGDILIWDSGGVMPRLKAKFLARSIVALFAVVLEGIGEAAIAGKNRNSVQREFRPVIQSLIEKIEV